ncbi:MAG: hypothetical protein WA741_26070, partial [Candidatus Sulfotelmatobacter sp.]
AAEVDGIGLYEFGIELVLSDDLAETVADLWAGAVAIRILWLELLAHVWNAPDFLDRAETNAVCLPQRAIYRSGLGHSHLGTADERRDIGRIGVTIADKALAVF